MNLLKPLAVAAALTFTAFTASAVTTYDAAADFSTASNPNGVWSYGTTNGFNSTTFTLLPDNTPITVGSGSLASWNPVSLATLPAVYKNTSGSPITAGTATYAAGSIGFHPGDGNMTAVYRFTAPTTSQYSFSGSFFAQDTQSTTSQVGVLVNGTLQGPLLNISSATPTSLSFATSLSAGQFIDVEVGNFDGNKNYDSTGLTLTITAVPEPETVALMLAGLAAVGFVAKRRKS